VAGSADAEGSVWIFAGQGAERPRMTDGLSDVPALLSQVRAVAGLDLSELCYIDGSPCWDTVTAQIAILVVTVASVNACRRYGVSPVAVLGHSFGEYGALVAAEALTFEDAVRLAVARGQEMAAAVDGASGMMAVMGLSHDEVRRVCTALRRRGAMLNIAAYNSPTQTVLAGSHQALRDAASACRDAGAARNRTLPVPFAAHSPQMRPVRARLERELRRVRLSRPRVPVYSCATGRSTTDPAELQRLLAWSVTEPVRFHQTVATALAAGYSSVLEVGSDFPPRLLSLVSEICSRDLANWPMPRLAAIAADADAPYGRIFEPQLTRRQ
jgi:[acyl-carrier-protein] S-malonyltransferase